MRIAFSCCMCLREQETCVALAPAGRGGNVLASAKFPCAVVVRPHCGLADVISPAHVFAVADAAKCDAAKLLRSDGGATETAKPSPQRNRARDVTIESRAPPTGLQTNGQSFRICTSAVSIRAALHPPASRLTCDHPDVCCCSGCLFGGHAIRRQISGRWLVRGTKPRGSRMAGIRFSHVIDRRR